MPPSRFPAVSRAKLSNGIDVVIAERPGSHLVDLPLVLDIGTTSDPVGQTGLSELEAATLLDGTANLNALAFEDRKIALGAELTASAGIETTRITLAAPSERLDGALDLFTDVVLRPALRPADVSREKALLVAKIAQLKQDPVNSAFRTLSPLVFGPGHPYGRLDTEAGMAALTPDQVRQHHDLWFQPTRATLVVVGDVTLASVLPKFEAKLGHWRSSAAVLVKTVAQVAPVASSVIYLIDKPGAEQTVISAAEVAPSRRDQDELAIQAMSTTLGGAFTSRLNLNLREDKHWAYGAFSFVAENRDAGLFAVLAPVQADKTTESFREVRRELTEIVGNRPIISTEFDLARHSLTLSLPGRWETGSAVAASLAESATYGLPDDYWNTYATRVGALQMADANRAAVRVVKPGAITWVIVGDSAKIKAPLETLGLPVKSIDADGKPLP